MFSQPNKIIQIGEYANDYIEVWRDVMEPNLTTTLYPRESTLDTITCAVGRSQAVSQEISACNFQVHDNLHVRESSGEKPVELEVLQGRRGARISVIA